jgi:poly(3-hydroxybutyrate) depolymerase
VPFFYLSGDADPLNPVNGGEVDLMLWGVRYQKTPLAAIHERWRKIDGCGADERREMPHADVTIRIWDQCRDGSEVRYGLIRNHGHHWPAESGVGLPEHLVGPRSNVLDATTAIWSFLSRFSLR